ncbi:MAG: ATP-binding protein [Spirochaetales bacterium]|jgi:predicted AAA+ superfamily ATPase|nr:ATP-binding protein [Spirochaetales bacterium]
MVHRRDAYPEKIANGFKYVPIIVLIGARQVGKTSIMKDFGENMTAGKTCIFLNGQDPEISALFQKLTILESYLKAHINPGLEGFLLLDEFQFIPGISTMLKVLTDKHQNLKVLCSGSSSLDILSRVEESLAGRVRTIEVLSLSFAEYLLFNDRELSALYRSLDAATPTSALTAPIETLFNEYLVYGGLPRLALTRSHEEKIEILNDIYQTYLLQDIRTYISRDNIVGLNKLLRIAASQTGNLVNVNALSRDCGLSYKTCEEYLNILEQMGIIKMLEPYFVNRQKVIGKMKKLYFLDLGLRNMIEKNFTSIDYRPDNGALFENLVMLELWRVKGTGGELQFFRTSDGAEVDFVVNRLGKKAAIECKFKFLTKPISLAAFNHFCDSESIQERYIVNRSLNAEHPNAKFLQGFFAGKI